MSALTRNNVKVFGKGPAMVFAHGFGCDHNMWRFVAPAFADRYQVILFDNVGAGRSDLGAYSFEKYARLDGFADDIVEIGHELGLQDAVLVGHSVSAMIGLIAAQKAEGMFKSVVLVAPSPCYFNDGAYTGGFTKAELEELVEAMDSNFLGWSASMAPAIMGNPDRSELGDELTNSFCRTDPAIAKHFGRTTFMSDCRGILPAVAVPTLILQCSDDVLAPGAVGDYLHREIAGSKLVVLEATGHCPNLSAPEETIAAINGFLP